MSDRILNWGLLSTARINKVLIPPLKESTRNRLFAVGSRSVEQAEAYGREWGIPRVHGSYEALLADPEVDVIYNPLPNSLHTEWTVKAAQAGKHVLCEKPLTLSVAEVDEIAAAAQQSGVVVAEAFMYRHHPQTIKVKELVDEGAVGKLMLIRGSFSFLLKDPNDIRLNRELGGGSIWDLGCYPISYTRYLVGAEPMEVFGRQVTSSGGVDETFAGQMRFPGEIFGQFDSSLSTPFRVIIEVVGSEGYLTVPMPFAPQTDEIILLNRDGEKTEIRIPGQYLYAGEVEDMADAVLSGRPPRVSLAFSRGNIAAISALLESASTGQPVTLNR